MYLMVDTFRFTDWLKQKRGAESFRKLAERCGVSASYLSNMEKGTFHPTDEVLRPIAVAFDVDPEWLIAQVETTRPHVQETVERLRKHAPDFLEGLEAREPAPPTYRESSPLQKKLAAGLAENHAKRGKPLPSVTKLGDDLAAGEMPG